MIVDTAWDEATRSYRIFAAIEKREILTVRNQADIQQLIVEKLAQSIHDVIWDSLGDRIKTAVAQALREEAQ